MLLHMLLCRSGLKWYSWNRMIKPLEVLFISPPELSCHLCRHRCWQREASGHSTVILRLISRTREHLLQHWSYNHFWFSGEHWQAPSELPCHMHKHCWRDAWHQSTVILRLARWIREHLLQQWHHHLLSSCWIKEQQVGDHESEGWLQSCGQMDQEHLQLLVSPCVYSDVCVNSMIYMTCYRYSLGVMLHTHAAWTFSEFMWIFSKFSRFWLQGNHGLYLSFFRSQKNLQCWCSSLSADVLLFTLFWIYWEALQQSSSFSLFHFIAEMSQSG